MLPNLKAILKKCLPAGKKHSICDRSFLIKDCHYYLKKEKTNKQKNNKWKQKKNSK